MKKRCVLIGFVVFFFFFILPFAHGDAGWRGSGHWVARSQDNTLVVIGIANRLIRRQDEIAVAKIDAARKIAMFYGISGTVESFHETGANFVFDTSSRLEYTTEYARFIERLRFDPKRDVTVIDRATLVRFSYAANVTPVDFVGTINAEGRPNWLNSRYRPKLDGYMVAVGVSQRRLLLADTAMRSVNAAAERMIRARDTEVRHLWVDVPGLTPVVFIHTISRGALSNFRVLEFWIDPVSGNVYTLAIARLVE